MVFHTYGNKTAPSLMLLPGLGVSFEIFMPLIGHLQQDFHIIAVEVDGFILGKHSEFTSIDDQAAQANGYIKDRMGGRIDYAYGLSMGGKILSRMLERDEISVNHAILDAAPLLPLPKWLVGPLRYYQCANVWTCFHWTGFWKFLFRSHYFSVLLDECRKVWPYGRGQAVLDGYKDIYTNRLESVKCTDIHFWYGTKEAFVAKPQAQHLQELDSDAHVEIFQGMNHGQLLIDRPEEIALRIRQMDAVNRSAERNSADDRLALCNPE
ncbi:MAG: alpha/beta hydrolase [Bacteroidales bacterium]|nr:alpha/beta hydrolase [Bacteroidales bacterium]